MAATTVLPPKIEFNRLNYEQKDNYKLRIFETICQDANLTGCHDVFINKMLERVEHIYEELTKK